MIFNNHRDFTFYFLNVLENNQVNYMLFCGTLLGAIRDNSFLPGDHCDTDIAVDDSQYWNIRRILDKEHIKNNTFFYYSIWRKEISIMSHDHKYKLDIFFLEKQENKYYIYSNKPNPENKAWNFEWRAWFDYNDFYPTRKFNFMNRLCNIPNNYDKILTEHYGNWRIPEPGFDSVNRAGVDKNYPGFYPSGFSGSIYKPVNKKYDFGYICSNFLRPETTKKCIESLQQYYPNAKIYIADQDAPSGDMIHFYETHNIEYYYIPFDSGISYARNFLINKVQEPYVMWGDNDFVFDETSNIYNGVSILKNNENIGLVGGSVYKNGNIQHYERLLLQDKERGILIYLPLELTNPEKQTCFNIDYYDCDLTFNYCIAKKEIFNDTRIKWTPELKVAYEHSSFFLNYKNYSDLKCVYCPSMSVIHEHKLEEQTYDSFRKRTEGRTIFAKTHNLKMNFTIGSGREIYETGELKKIKEEYK